MFLLREEIADKTMVNCQQRIASQNDIITSVATPRLAQKGGVALEIFISFLVSVMASVTAYYICKWFDRDDDGNEPKA